MVAVAAVNFLVFAVVALMLGGDAVNGKIEAGRYYLANHGILTEVSYSVFLYSKLHVYSVFVTHPLGMLAGVVLSRTHNKQPKPLHR